MSALLLIANGLSTAIEVLARHLLVQIARHNISRVWDNGAESPHDFGFQELVEFKQQTGATHCVATRWTHDQATHEVAGAAFVLPDRTGVVVGGTYNHQPHQLQVRNADGSVRFTLRSQLEAEEREHGCATLDLPREGWPTSDIPFGVIAVFANEPACAVMLDIDWTDGRLIRVLPLPRGF